MAGHRFNEQLRRSERRSNFNVDALITAICHCTNRPAAEFSSLTKLAEGGFNRVLQATFKDGYNVLARIPFRTLAPAHYAVASEAATLTLLSQHGIPVPKVLGYSSQSTNPVGTEYLLLEKLQGTPLGERWFTLDTKAQVKIMRQVVNLETRFMKICFPASGSLYFEKDLTNSEAKITVSGPPSETDSIVVGPTAEYEWWFKERSHLDVDRGPWCNFLSTFEAPARREIQFCQQYGRARQHVERYLREMYHCREILPDGHIQLLQDFLKLAPHLAIHPDRFSRPVLRHPDFSPNNILVSPGDDIVGLIDWQHAVVLPLCLCAGIPKYFQNWGDPFSEKLAKPETKLPQDFETLSPEEQASTRELIRKRLIHFYYAAMTMKLMPDHYDALRRESLILRAKIFDRTRAPWEGDSVLLKFALIHAIKKWPLAVSDDKSTDGCMYGAGSLPEAPVRYSEDEIRNCVEEHNQRAERMQELEEMQNFLGTDAIGWVPDNEHYEKSKALIQSIKAGMLEHSESDLERSAVRDHFPFDDHDET